MKSPSEKKPVTFYKHRRGHLVRVSPCYCGGYLHYMSETKRGKLVWQIQNCYSKRKFDGMKRIRKEQAEHVKL